MRYFLDCEFIEDGCTIEPISIGVVAEDGREFYAESSQVPWHRASDWVNENVRPHLVNDTPVTTTEGEIARRLRDFIGDDSPEFWSWCSAYDWVAICQLYGSMVDKPAGWPSYCRDIQQELDRYGIGDDQLIGTVPQDGDAHNALADARWHRDIHAWLTERVPDAPPTP